jgi:hypothetical protein
MKLDNIVSITGLPGLHKLVASRPNGLLIEALDTKKRQFVSARKHQFTPLVSVGIYTYMDTIGLDEVIKKVHASETTAPIPDVNDKADTLRAWFKGIVPEHDEDRVHINDIRKLLKWSSALKMYVWDEINNEEGITKSEEETSNNEDEITNNE